VSALLALLCLALLGDAIGRRDKVGACVFVVGMLLFGAAIARAQTPCLQYNRDVLRSAWTTFGPGAPVADLFAQLHVESACRPGARSRVGAEGLAQFMPATAADMARLHPEQCAPANPFDPAWAIRCRDRYMRSLLRQQRAMIEPALTECRAWWFAYRAYNGGQGWNTRDRRAALAAQDDPDDPMRVALYNAGRSAANHRENTEYAPKIWRFSARYPGRSVCNGEDIQ
jgi:soluble lytic murein transglycosylase-like protein